MLWSLMMMNLGKSFICNKNGMVGMKNNTSTKNQIVLKKYLRTGHLTKNVVILEEVAYALK